jgi:hypothetical protein
MTHGNIIAEYHFLKRKVKKLIMKAENIGPLQQPRAIKKIASLMKKLAIIVEDCKEMGIPHPDAFNEEDGPSLQQINNELFNTPTIRSTFNTDGTLYSKYASYQQEGIKNLNKMMVRSNPDGQLFETPALEGSFMARRTESD